MAAHQRRLPYFLRYRHFYPQYNIGEAARTAAVCRMRSAERILPEEKRMNTPTLETERLILRKFTENDLKPCIGFTAMRRQIDSFRGFL